MCRTNVAPRFSIMFSLLPESKEPNSMLDTLNEQTVSGERRQSIATLLGNK